SGSPVTFTATGTAGGAATIAANSATSQSATAGTAVSAPPSVIVKDANGNPVVGVAVTFAVARAEGRRVGGGRRTQRGGGAGGELDPERDGRHERADGDVGVARWESGDLHGDGDRGSGGDDCREQCDEPVGHGGDRCQRAAVGDRQGREREPRGGRSGDVRGG